MRDTQLIDLSYEEVKVAVVEYVRTRKPELRGAELQVELEFDWCKCETIDFKKAVVFVNSRDLTDDEKIRLGSLPRCGNCRNFSFAYGQGNCSIHETSADERDARWCFEPMDEPGENTEEGT